MQDSEAILHGARRSIVFLSAHQAEHYGGYAPAALAHKMAIILPSSMIEEYHQDLAHLPQFYEAGHA